MKWNKLIYIIMLVVISVIISTNIICADVSPEKRVGYENMPAVVMIKTTYSGQLQDIDGNQFIEDTFEDINYHLNIPPEAYGAQGSGFVVSSDGYIATNAHVVDDQIDDVKREIAKETAAEMAINFILSAYKNSVEMNFTTEDLYNHFYDKLISDRYVLKDTTKDIEVYFGGFSDSKPDGIPAEFDSTRSSPMQLWSTGSGDEKMWHRSGKDVAVIKIEPRDSVLPNVKLGDPKKVQVGDKIIVIGYPGVAQSSDTNNELSAETDYVPTVTSGIVSAIKTQPGGITIFQTDASIYHGNSGGPAFDENGNVIGIATYAAVDPNSAINVQGFNFLIPIDRVKEYLTSVDTTPSETTQHYWSGLNYYWNNDTTKAQDEFSKISALDSLDRYATEYRSIFK